ncbi:teichoic acid glycosylation protein [Aerococcus urinaehominis]|uniref:Teichoic acid glycosylation protein n=1 Tax=Aerococcus urinaehominis TaxID=128944 RepID=A0A120IAM9_9LACT|nr:GtrA family protein [Aerococcus urinaehominis]AMB98574.1 teichoic acid glycosylation protein [Aerococcus urinaehominis]SDL77424.1 Putative flippase GtrA (transmembrane translocase of bactoprenol-linked glucose) [Aerococcus urinaehominis]
MKDQLRQLIKKFTNREVLAYLIFGLLTTLVNILSFTILRSWLSLLVANSLAWLLSVIFAFVTNKIWVFSSSSWSWPVVSKELASFIFFRLASLVADNLIIICLTWLGLSELFGKFISQIAVVILNYIFSKVFIFKQ